MEDKQLDFNRPLLSVRRYTPSITSHRYDQTKTDNSRPVIPRPPPHRTELKSGPIRNPGAVPFIWEQTPGQPKHQEIKPEARDLDRPPMVPKLPPGRLPKANQQDSSKVSPSASDNKSQAINSPLDSLDAPYRDENVKNENRKETIEEKESSDSGDSEALYVDALDTLSRTESFFLNCSMSGVSTSDALDARPFTDPKTRDFMMDRFLPAAKAMASETTPQYAAKKQPVVQEQTQEQKKIVVNKNKPLLRYGPSFAQQYSHYPEEGEEEESDEEYDQPENLPGVCGLLPRFCLKSSLCRLNPVPAMSVRTRVPMSPANRIRPRSSSSGSYCETENESRSDASEIKPMNKIQKSELGEDMTKLRNESSHIESHSASEYHDAPVPFVEEKDVLGIQEGTTRAGIKGFGFHGNGVKTFEQLLVDQGSEKEFDSGGLDEKTLYVDTVEQVESKNLRPFSPDTQDIKGVSGSREEFNEIITTVDGQQKLLLNGDFNISSSTDESDKKLGMEMPKAFGETQDFSLYSTTTENIQGSQKEASESLEKQQTNAIIPVNPHRSNSKFPAPPPLPKSPSDSWLGRTLPSMSAKNFSLRTAMNPQNQVPKAHTSDMKWETIVKTTKVQRHHLRYSEEMLTTIPET